MEKNNNTSQKIRNWFKSIFILDYKELLKRLIIALICYTIFMIIDRMTKEFIFTKDQYSFEGQFEYERNWGIIGFKPVLNNGAAFSSFLGAYAFLQTIALLMFIATFATIFFQIKIKYLIPVIFVGAGALGNGIDRFIYDGYVRDMLYWPWWPTFAIFNFADSFIVVSTVSLIIMLVIELFKDSGHERTGKVA